MSRYTRVIRISPPRSSASFDYLIQSNRSCVLRLANPANILNEFRYPGNGVNVEMSKRLLTPARRSRSSLLLATVHLAIDCRGFPPDSHRANCHDYLHERLFIATLLGWCDVEAVQVNLLLLFPQG